MHCKDCGKSIDDDSKFCRFCGIAQIKLPDAPSAATSVQTAPVTPADAKADPIFKYVAWIGGGIFLLMVIVAIAGGSSNSPTGSSTDLNLATAADLAMNDPTAVDVSTANPEPEPNWSYSTDQDKVRGATSYYAMTTSTNSIPQGFPYDSETTMTMTVRESPAYGTDVILTISSGQMMCPSYDGCEGTVRFDDGPAENISFNGPADSSSDTIFVEGAERFISKLKKSKKVVIEKTLYEAGSPQFEFKVDGLKWDH
jgi:hypothetical protein